MSESFSLRKDRVKKSPWKPCPASVLRSVTGSTKGMIKRSPEGPELRFAFWGPQCLEIMKRRKHHKSEKNRGGILACNLHET